MASPGSLPPTTQTATPTSLDPRTDPRPPGHPPASSTTVDPGKHRSRGGVGGRRGPDPACSCPCRSTDRAGRRGRPNSSVALGSGNKVANGNVGARCELGPRERVTNISPGPRADPRRVRRLTRNVFGFALVLSEPTESEVDTPSLPWGEVPPPRSLTTGEGAMGASRVTRGGPPPAFPTQLRSLRD